jgi:hypothetical protein
MKEEELRIQDYLSRPGRYANIDGLNELGWGAILCGFSGFEWLNAISPRDSLWHRPLALVLYTLAMALSIYLAGKALKRYVTYPRTGFVAYPDDVRCRVAPLVAVAVAVPTALVAGAFMRRGLHEATLLGAANLLFYAFAAQPLRPWKYGFLLLIASGTIWVADANALLFFGLTFLASGATTLALYLRQTRAPQ